MEEFAKQYSPRDTEDKWYKYWEEQNLFCAGVDTATAKEPFTIVIPPPNVTGILHMGHALNNTIQDILIRYHRACGCEALWIPGTDHAGIATQNVVEKSIAKENLTRQQLGRDEFIKRVWAWREKYGSTIILQLKKLGSSCDWRRLRFTMDEAYSKSVTTAFISLYDKGLIYQGNYIINWCPRCQTALSDEEAAHQDLQGSLYYLKYPLEEGPGYVAVATTRPETMLGDTAVAVNPKDKRYKKLIGKNLILPLVNRKIKIIADASIDMEFGTGAVKVTPAHDPNDYLLGKKHALEFINVLTPDGKINKAGGSFCGLDRFKAREAILDELKSKDLLEKIQPHSLSAGHCYRCHTIVEPYLSKQWFVRTKPLSQPAIKAVKSGKIKFHPERWAKVYLNWMENIQDWCISRQIWWGHRLPVYYCKSCLSQAEESTVNNKKGIIVSQIRPENCPECGSGDIYQDEDVLDTWFSSWLWPFAALSWPLKEKDLAYFYPTSALVTAPEIIFFWVARMIMAGFEFMGQEPFKDVYIHGTVRDIEGKKMSKSLGNIIDPLEIISEYGADALRFSLISITAQGQDVFLSKERFEQGRNFANKIWNASRFILMNYGRDKVKVDLSELIKSQKLNTANRWILSRFNHCLKQTEGNLNKFKFNEAANALYSFFWHEFCDWYLELIKPQIKEKQNQEVMYYILEHYLLLLHPFMPFISEEIWQKISPRQESIMRQGWPQLRKDLIDSRAEKQMQLGCEIIAALRNMRSELEIPAQNLIQAKIFSPDKHFNQTAGDFSGYIKNLAKLSDLEITAENYRPGKNEYAAVLKDAHLVIPLEGVVDIRQQLRKFEASINKLKNEIKNKELMLENKNFTSRAPKEIVAAEKAKLVDLSGQLKKNEAIKNALR